MRDDDEKRDGLFVVVAYVIMAAALYGAAWVLHLVWEEIG